MTDKELKKLKRADLLEILFFLQKELETLREENESLKRQIESINSARSLPDEDIERIVAAVEEAVRQSVGSQFSVGGESAGKVAVWSRKPNEISQQSNRSKQK